ncbi:MAG TPA: O-antigen ligase family protein [Lacunisphaera sp.]|jgi:hypothetical protein|nr:O-antigen ligase family protein [Lacunisphaera sp.]
MNQLPIYLETKDLIGLVLLILGSIATTFALLAWPRLRLPVFFVMVAGAIGTSFMDFDAYSAYWYRGTTRGFEFTGIDVLAFGLLLSSLIRPRPSQPRWFWPVGLAPMLLFLAYCIGSTLFATPMIFGLYEISKMLRALMFFTATAFFVRDRRDLGVLVLALAAAVGAETVLALRERYLLGLYRPHGTLDHSNSLSLYLCMVTPVLIAAGCSQLTAWIRWICWGAVLAACVTILLTLSRAGLPIFVLVVGGALLWAGSWRPTPLRALAGAIAVVALAGLFVNAWPLLSERYGQSTLHQELFEPGEGETRGYYFRQAAVMLEQHPFGVGLNNWSYWVSREYGKPLGMNYQNYDDLLYAPPSDLAYMYRFAAPAHDLGVLTAAELGWTGLAVLALVWLRWLWNGAGFLFGRDDDVRRKIGLGIFFGLVGVFLQSLTEWTFRQTPIFLTVHMLVGVLAALRMQRQLAAARAAQEAAESAVEWDLLGEPAAARLEQAEV